MGLPSFSSCPHVLEVTVQLDPGLQTRVPGQGPASSWGLDLGAPFLSISHSRATPTAGVRVRVTAAHAGLRSLTQAWWWSGADSPAPELTKLQDNSRRPALDTALPPPFHQSTPGPSWPYGLCWALASVQGWMGSVAGQGRRVASGLLPTERTPQCTFSDLAGVCYNT